MTDQRYFEDTEPGDEFEEQWLAQKAQIVAYFAVNDPSREVRPDRFTDDEAAQKVGMPRAIVPGALALCQATRVVTDWMGPQGRLHSIDVDFRRPMLHEDSLKILGLITDTLEDAEGRPTVKLDVYLENERGERPVQGTAIVELPRKP